MAARDLEPEGDVAGVEVQVLPPDADDLRDPGPGPRAEEGRRVEAPHVLVAGAAGLREQAGELLGVEGLRLD